MPSLDRIRLNILFAAMGAVAVAAQIVTMRRLVVVFGGNELVTGGVFAGWLGFSCMGAAATGRLARRWGDFDLSAAFSLFLLAASIPLTVALSYLIKPALGIPAPVMVGPQTALALSAALMAPTGLIIGASFTLCARLAGERDMSSVPRVYLMDAIGAGAGGLAVSLFAVRMLTSFQISIVAASFMAAAVGVCFLRMRIKLAAMALILCLAAAMAFSRPIQKSFAEELWRGFNPAVEMESLLASLMVTDNRGERTLFVDGVPSFTLPADYTYESIATLPLLQHGRAEDILMIEGGLYGTAAQWSKWPLGSAQFLRLDPDVTYLEENAMPSERGGVPTWVTLRHGDGRRFVAKGEFGSCSGPCFDVITVNVGNPDTAASDRYFTREFFGEAKAALREGGVLGVWMLEPQNAIGSEALELLGGLYATLRSSFRKVAIVPLDRFYFFATDEGAVTESVGELMARLKRSGVDSPYVAEQLLPGVSQERVDSFAAQIAAAADAAPVNTDSRPRAYFNGMILWEKRFGSGSSWFASMAQAARPWVGGAALLILMAASAAWSRVARRGVGATWALAAVGFSSMSYGIALLIHCQMVMGVMLVRLGFIITAFMAGAGLGAWAGLAARSGRGASRATLVVSLLCAAAWALLMLSTSRVSFIASNLVMGAICGFVYQAAASVVFAGRGEAASTAGAVQGADLAGAVAGSLTTGLLVIPVLGTASAAAMASIALCAAAFMALIDP
ncbi:MAG: fused MFS/spermidine synthase [Proteobacteria bacterium]|nr:fused MFS/spermidine synthase [Pseudomonadota bacterium]